MFEQHKIENELIRRDINIIINKYKSEIVGKYEAPEEHNKLNEIMVKRWKRLLIVSKLI